MERIAKLIFAATALWLFYLVLLFSMVAVSGNGGEYWGFDGQVEPRRAARQSFDAGETRFLAYRLSTEFSGIKQGFPNTYRCDFHSGTPDSHIRFNQIDARHGYDSVRKANEFARQFNYSLVTLIWYENKSWCERVE